MDSIVCRRQVSSLVSVSYVVGIHLRQCVSALINSVFICRILLELIHLFARLVLIVLYTE